MGKCRQIKVLLKNVSALEPYVGEIERERESLSPTPAMSTDGLEEQDLGAGGEIYTTAGDDVSVCVCV